MQPYDDFKTRVLPGWERTLEDVLARARALGPRAVLAFDLDSTLFDNRPRQARILAEYGRTHGVPALASCRPEHWNSGWDLRAAMVACGLSAQEADASYGKVKRFWQERFFTSEYCVDDVPLEGAAAFTHAAKGTGALVAYVTGRHEEMRAGSVECMRRGGLVLPDGERVRLIMKPTLLEDDDAFKCEAHAELHRLGTLVAAFDNEPTHANDYRRNFPEATVIHLATDHSGRPVELASGIISVPHFGLTAA
jgi:hypothetical protein